MFFCDKNENDLNYETCDYFLTNSLKISMIPLKKQETDTNNI